MKPTTFATIHPDVLVIPANPGTTLSPSLITEADSAKNITDIYRTFALKQNIYTEYRDAKRISVKLTLNTIDSVLYKVLKHQHTGYSSVTFRALLDHLFNTYTEIN